MGAPLWIGSVHMDDCCCLYTVVQTIAAALVSTQNCLRNHCRLLIDCTRTVESGHCEYGSGCICNPGRRRLIRN